MLNLDRTIKYIAIAFATLILVGSVQFIIDFVKTYTNNDTLIVDKTYELGESYKDLELEIKNAKVEFRTGNFKVETNSDKIKVTEKDEKLIVKDVSKNFIYKSNDKNIIIYTPEDFEFNNVDIEIGAGILVVNKITSKNLTINLGAGKGTLRNLNILENSKIETGAGLLEVFDVSINNLKLDLGVGKTTYKGTLTGKSELNCGIGSLNIDLQDSIDNYKLNVSKGLGSITLNEEKIKNDQIIGNGNNEIIISNGIGNIQINGK